MQVSISFLQRYREELLCIKLNPHADSVKGKSIITLDRTARQPSVAAPEKELAWIPPVLNWVKLNRDGSFVSSSSAGGGMIPRHNMGSIIFSACRALWSCRDALKAKLCACMEALSLALRRSDLPIAIEMDSSMAVSMISCATLIAQFMLP